MFSTCRSRGTFSTLIFFDSLRVLADHDQEQTPEKAKPGGGSYPDYRVDGECVEQCDCGGTNPCAEYIFDNSGKTVEGRNFTEWFINEYMVTNETLLHKNPTTGKPQVIGLGWLDDSMTPHGPTEEDRNYMADCGYTAADMAKQVASYKTSMTALVKKVVPMGGYWCAHPQRIIRTGCDRLGGGRLLLPLRLLSLGAGG
jgi:hypothetical protein